MSHLVERPHVLYRFFDAKGQLLYVGITVRIRERLARHEIEKIWYGQIHRITVDHFPTRDAVLAAEKSAIQTEKPLHNVHHNGPKAARKDAGRIVPGAPGERKWTFETRRGYERTTPLRLVWEARCDPISDDYYIDEIEPEDLWREWVRRYPKDEDAERVYGPGAVGISWYVDGGSIFESAPFQDHRRTFVAMRRLGWSVEETRKYISEHNFLRHFTTPYDDETGEPIQWTALPVMDKVWREHDLPKGPHTFKGGFIQEATGWKPSPLQPFVNIELLALAAGLTPPSIFRDQQKGAA